MREKVIRSQRKISNCELKQFVHNIIEQNYLQWDLGIRDTDNAGILTLHDSSSSSKILWYSFVRHNLENQILDGGSGVFDFLNRKSSLKTGQSEISSENTIARNWKESKLFYPFRHRFLQYGWEMDRNFQVAAGWPAYQ